MSDRPINDQATFLHTKSAQELNCGHSLFSFKLKAENIDETILAGCSYVIFAIGDELPRKIVMLHSFRMALEDFE